MQRSMHVCIDTMLRTLQVPSFDTNVAMLLLEAELGGPWTDFYSELTPKPIAAASLGQVRTSSWTACLSPTQNHVIDRQDTKLCTAATNVPSDVVVVAGVQGQAEGRDASGSESAAPTRCGDGVRGPVHHPVRRQSLIKVGSACRSGPSQGMLEALATCSCRALGLHGLLPLVCLQ
jgi:ABC1 atypical kinase-like domain